MNLRSKARGLWQWWKGVAHKIGDVQARIILIVFYFLIMAPFALVMRFWSDPLRLHSKEPNGWIPRSNTGEPPEKRAREQF